MNACLGSRITSRSLKNRRKSFDKKASSYALQHVYSPAKVDMLLAIQVTLVHLKGNVPDGKTMFTISKPPTLREKWTYLYSKQRLDMWNVKRNSTVFIICILQSNYLELFTHKSNISFIISKLKRHNYVEQTQVEDRTAKLLWLFSNYGTSWKLLMRFHFSPWTSSCTWENISRTFCKEWTAFLNFRGMQHQNILIFGKWTQTMFKTDPIKSSFGWLLDFMSISFTTQWHNGWQVQL